VSADHPSAPAAPPAIAKPPAGFDDKPLPPPQPLSGHDRARHFFSGTTPSRDASERRATTAEFLRRNGETEPPFRDATLNLPMTMSPAPAPPAVEPRSAPPAPPPSPQALAPAAVADAIGPTPAPAPAPPAWLIQARGDRNLESQWAAERGADPIIAAPPRARWFGRSHFRSLVLVFLAFIAVGEAVLLLRRPAVPASPPAPTGMLVVDSDIPGAEVWIDNDRRGATPLTTQLSPGDHKVELRSGNDSRAIRANIKAGVHVWKYVEFESRPRSGSLRLASEPPGAQVFIDEKLAGISPLTVHDLAPGDHIVRFTSEVGQRQHRVRVRAGETSTVVAPLSEADAAGLGWLDVVAPIDLQVFQGRTSLGSTSGDPIPLAPGRHALDLSAPALEFRTTVDVEVKAGETSRIEVALPSGVIDVDAPDGSAVYVDGVHVGQAPLDSVTATIGRREIVVRRPDGRERRHSVLVTLGGPARVRAQ
jgi:hypothetical protein